MQFEADTARGGSVVLFPGALGDAVCLEPAVAYLARSGPVVLHARGGAAEVAKLFPADPIVRSLDTREIAALFGPAASEAQAREGAAADLRWLEPFARIVSFTGAGVPEVEERLAATRRAVLAPFPAPGSGVHASDYFLQRVSGDPSARAGFPRLVPGLGTAALDRVGTATLVMHPGAGSARKRAPFELFGALGDLWRAETRGNVTVLLGPGEFAERTLYSGSADRVRVPGTVVELAGEIARATAFVGNDSGPSHVAAGLGARGLVLFRSAPDRFAPRSERLAALRIDGISVAEAASAVRRVLAPALP